MSKTIRIAVLDGFTLADVPIQRCVVEHAGEQAKGAVSHGVSDDSLDWGQLAKLGDLDVYGHTLESQIIERAKGAQILLTNKVVLTESTLCQLPSLRYVGVLATGVNNVDLQAASDLGITVTNVPAYSTDSVAQHVFALLLELIHATAAHSRLAADGTWSRHQHFSYCVAPISELAGKTLGIVGVGAIGSRVAKIGTALGMGIVAAHQSSMAAVRIDGVNIDWLPLEEMLALADVVTLHCPLTDQTRHLINAPRLAMMKRSAILINTGRGPLIDEAALAEGLHQGRLAGAGLDVLSVEPPPLDHPLLDAPGCVITPHIAWASVEARRRLMDQAVRNVQAFVAGAPINVVT